MAVTNFGYFFFAECSGKIRNNDSSFISVTTRIKNLSGRVSRMEPPVLIRRFFPGGGGWGSRYLRNAELVNHDQCETVRKCCGFADTLS